MTKLEGEDPPQSTEKEKPTQGCQDEAASPVAEVCTAATADEAAAAAETGQEEKEEESSADANAAVPEDATPDAPYSQGKKVGTASVSVPLDNLVDEDYYRMTVEWKDLVDRKGTNRPVQDCPKAGKDVKNALRRSCGVLSGLEIEEARIVQKQAGLPTPNPSNDDAPEDESIHVLAQIQPLPLERCTGNSGVPPAVAGAYAISTAYPQGGPPQREFTLTTEGLPPHLDAGRVDISDNIVPGASNQLVEARLVDEEAVVIAAEELNSCGISRRTSIICWGQLFLIIALAVTLTAVLVPKDNDNSSSLKLEDKSDMETEIKISQATHPCMESTEELWGALDAYYKDKSPNTNVSRHYGWPIGKWCVSQVGVFFKMFTPGRNGDSETITHFHEDIGSWDMSNARELEQTMRGCRNVSASWGIQNWDTQSVTNVQELFMMTSWREPALDLSSWNTSSVWNMGQLFRKSDVVKANISSWDTSNVRSMSQFASEANNFKT